MVLDIRLSRYRNRHLVVSVGGGLGVFGKDSL